LIWLSNFDNQKSGFPIKKKGFAIISTAGGAMMKKERMCFTLMLMFLSAIVLPLSAQTADDHAVKIVPAKTKAVKAETDLAGTVPTTGKMIPLSPEKIQERLKTDKRLAALAASSDAYAAYALTLDWDWQTVTVPSVFNQPEFYYWSQGGAVTALEIRSTWYTNTFGAWTSPSYYFNPIGTTDYVVFYVYLYAYDYNSPLYDPYYYPGLRIRINSGDENFVTTKELYSKSYPSYNMPPDQYAGYTAMYILTADVSEEVVNTFRFSLDLMDFDPADCGNLSYILTGVEAWFYY
jgi:hypothetical protein